MNRNIKTTQYELTPEIATYLDERLAAIERLIQGKHSVCDVELEKVVEQVHGNIWRAEMNLEVEGHLYRGEATGESMNAAIDALKDEMMRHLRKEKTKEMSMIKRGGAMVKEWLRFGRGEE